ncbi:MAG: murein biosynthesis integral membrane protein MurJ [Anaerolineaceae bacterium]|nr:murein biosynthesis integral membrane protein MurJ [Anaerolineaceae bacterium]
MTKQPEQLPDSVLKRADTKSQDGSEEGAANFSEAGGQIARAAALVVAAFIISNIFGLGQQLAMSRYFGTGQELDSYNAANRLTELLFNLVAGGALGSAFIPMFTGMLTRKDLRGAWKLASGVINVVSVALVAVAVLSWIFAPWVVQHIIYLLAPGTPLGQLDLTVRLLRIMLPTVVIFGVSGLVMGILNAHQQFLIPALAPSLYSIGIISGAVLWHKSLGVAGLAYGTLLGASLHLLIQLPSLFKLKTRSYSLSEGLNNPTVMKVVSLMLPRLVGAGVVQLNFVVNTMIALGLEPGSTAALSFAFILFMMPQRMIAQSAGIASLPTLSAQAELKQFDSMRSTLAGILRGILLLAIPSTFGMILIRYPLVRVLLERGEFNARSTEMVAWGLLWYCAGLVGHCLVEVLSRAFYALHDTKTPVGVGIGAMALNIVLSFTFSQWFHALGWYALGGLALANSLATVIESLVLLTILRKRLGGLMGRWILDSAWKAVLGTAAMSAAILAFSRLLVRNPRWNLFLGVLVGVLVYGLAMSLLKLPELQQVLGGIKRRLKRSA